MASITAGRRRPLQKITGDGTPTAAGVPHNGNGLYLGAEYTNQLTGDIWILQVLAGVQEGNRSTWDWRRCCASSDPTGP